MTPLYYIFRWEGHSLGWRCRDRDEHGNPQGELTYAAAFAKVAYLEGYFEQKRGKSRWPPLVITTGAVPVWRPRRQTMLNPNDEPVNGDAAVPAAMPARKKALKG